MNKSNQDRLNHLSSSIYNFICEYRKYCNSYFFDEEIIDLDNVKNILNCEDRGKDFMIDLSETFNCLTFSKDFSVPKEECFFDTICSIFKEYNNYINSYEKEFFVNSLANELVKYVKDSDPYEYRNNYINDEDAFNSIKKSLYIVSGVESIIEYFNSDIKHYVENSDLTNNDILNSLRSASDLLIKLNEYYKVFQKENNKEMDI